MPAGPQIRRVATRGFSILQDCTAGNCPDILKKSLVYGFNGSGKTTLSRIFASLQSGALSPDLPPGCQFEVQLADGRSLKSNVSLDALKEHILVFNTDFIEANLRWKEGLASPVFFIGQEQAELSRQLDAAISRAATLTPQYEESKRTTINRERAVDQYKRDTARLIAEQLSLGRRYDATDLVRDYGLRQYIGEELLPDGERQVLRTAIAQDAPLPKLAKLSALLPTLTVIFSRTQEVLDASLGAVVVNDLRNHEAMLHWISEGLDYHRSHDLASCLFCGNSFSAERAEALAGVIDSGFKRLTEDIATLRGELISWSESVRTLERAIPASNSTSKTLHARYTSTANGLRSMLARARGIGDQCAQLLDRKLKAPARSMGSLLQQATANSAEWDQQFTERLDAVNQLIEEHNRLHDDFAVEQRRAQEKLKNHYLAEAQEQYLALVGEAGAAKEAEERLKQQRDEAVGDADRLKGEIRQHGPAATRISQLIKNYLGHGALEVAPLDDGYEIRRNGRPRTGPLSEGEKTAIALCYFLSTVEADNRRLSNLIVVIDDPISSLDTKALHYAFGLIRSALGKAGQLIILAHNLHFMQEVKKWLKNDARKAQPTAALLFLDSVQQAVGASRSAHLCILPTLLREYESEYHYLFQVAHQFANGANNASDYLYLLPNALRKTLDIFLAFKVPGSAGLTSKLENVVGNYAALDPAKVQALDRLVQLESHADNLDDLVTFSSMTIEETKDAAKALMHLMETVDEGHYRQLCRLC